MHSDMPIAPHTGKYIPHCIPNFETYFLSIHLRALLNLSIMFVAADKFYFYFTVPLPSVIVTAPSLQRAGDSLTLECNATVVRSFASRVDVVWRSGSRVLRTVNDALPTLMGSSLVYTDSYTIPELCPCAADQREPYQCEVVINTSPPVMANDSITLNMMQMGKCRHCYIVVLPIYDIACVG